MLRPVCGKCWACGGAAAAIVAVCLGMAPFAARGQIYPAKPIKAFVGFAAGGASDVTARVLVPAATPREIVMRLNAVIAAIVNTPEMSDALRRQGLEPSTNSPEEFGAFLRNEITQNIRIAKAAGINVE